MSQLFSTLLFGDNEEFESFLGDELKGFMGRLSGSQESSPALRLPLLVLMGNDEDALAMAELATDEDGPNTQPASAQLFEKLEVIRIEESGLVCSICLGQLSIESEARRLPCSHVYHGNCIMERLKKNYSGELNIPCPAVARSSL
ncbi:E3 ubiquitin-protein ligase SIRP1-like isoform X1 [Hevea brasiliensis]|uniref:E3 ubiquitin-protein ligase SIRP1-like isoform X1 n=1 Tax=Hevea brasiliensis TaxID=3981 RepID=UPI0025E497DF|nr:E3 ubiquitin-protein ligase SIRP1-like isoform X1 [Hevea brasiliensis]